MTLKKLSFETVFFWSAIALYLVLIILSIIFYQERINIDSAYYFFNSLNKNWFHIEHQRYVLGIAELPVLIGNFVNIPLKGICIFFSVWHVLIFAIPGLLLSFFYKNKSYLLLFLLLQTVGILFSFVNPIFEMYYGIALLTSLYIILTNTKGSSFIGYSLFILLSFFIVSSHPFNICVYLFLLGLDFLSRKRLQYFTIGLILSIAFVWYKTQHASDYEMAKISWILDIKQNKTYLQLFEWDYWVSHLGYLVRHYWDWLVLLVICLFLGFKNLKRFQFIVLGGGILLSLLLINFSYALLDYSAYAEQIGYILVPVVLVPLFVEILPRTKNKSWYRIVIVSSVVIISVRLIMQYDIGQHYQQKTKWLMAEIDKSISAGSCKSIIPEVKNHELNSIIGWDVPFTSMIYSTINRGQTVNLTKYSTENTEVIRRIGSDQFLFRFDDIRSIESLNKLHFEFCNQESFLEIR